MIIIKFKGVTHKYLIYLYLYLIVNNLLMFINYK